jgi:hypothetical protein
MTYQFRNIPTCFNQHRITPEIAGTELGRIYEKNGALRPADVVNEARPNDAPLHPAFEWDNNVAGEKWRQEQARNMIRTVVVVTPDKDGEDLEERVYVNVRTDRESSYQPTRVVVKDDDLFESAWSQTIAQLRGAQKSLDELMRIAREERRADSERYVTALQLLRRAETVMVKGA